MIGLSPSPLALIPSEFSGRAKIVGCPSCRAALMLLMDESGRGTGPLEVTGYDLAESDWPGTWKIKGGYIHATGHRCPAARQTGPG